MRFVLYVSILLVILPFVLSRPFFGLCVYYIISIMEPKLLCWRGDFQDAVLVGVPLVIGAIAIGVKRKWVFPERDRASFKIKSVITRITRSPLFEPSWQIALFVLLIIYIAIARLLVPYPLENTSYQFRSLCKVLFVAALMTGLVTDSRRFRILYIVIAISAAFWAIKGGLNVLLIGPHQVYGKSYDNNLFALASVMTLPMVFYFGLSFKHTRWRMVFLIFSALMCLAIIGSRSRAGFVAFGVVLLCMAWSSRYRLRALFAVLLVIGFALATLGNEVSERIDSILAYRQDKSAQSRFYTWEVAQQLFLHNPVLGVGFNNFEIAKNRSFGGRRAAHNIYFQNLSELGLLGHPIWMAIIFGTLISIYRFMRRSRRLPVEMRWAYHCSRGLLLGLLAFCVHGFFHNEEYLELMFAIIGLCVAIQIVTKREINERRLYELIESDSNQTTTCARREPHHLPGDGHPGRMFDRPKSLSALIRYARVNRTRPA